MKHLFLLALLLLAATGNFSLINTFSIGMGMRF
jgi:hypothetical protein